MPAESCQPGLSGHKTQRSARLRAVLYNGLIENRCMLRPRHRHHIGTTAFFRNPAFLQTLVGLLLAIEHPRVLFHAASNGAEPLSFAATWREAGGGDILIEATDIEPAFLDQAGALQHPRVTPEIRALVRFLPPVSVVDFTSQTVYDAVVCMNALCYLTPDCQRRALWKMSAHSRRYVCVTAGDPEAVRDGIREANMRPVWRNWLPIYYGWRERLRLRYTPRKVWTLPYLPLMLPQMRYAGTSIFERVDR